jgi:DNA invertase Pin-like site-specific DNA recombinase
MFAEFPRVVPLNADNIQRVMVIGGGTSRSSVQEAGSHEPIELIRPKYGEMIDRMFPEPKIVTSLPHGPRRGGDRNWLAGLQKLVDTGQCDAIVVQSFCRLSRSKRWLWSFIKGLKTAGVRLISLSDQFDSSTDGWPGVPARLTLRTGFKLPVEFNSSS